MPGYRTHGVAFAAIFALVLACIFPAMSYGPLRMAYALVAGLAGTLFPDVDTWGKGRQLVQWLMFGAIFGAIFMAAYGLAFVLCLCVVVAVYAPHRTLFHNPIFIGACAFSCVRLFARVPATSSVAWWIGGWFLLGALFHVMLDRIT